MNQTKQLDANVYKDCIQAIPTITDKDNTRSRSQLSSLLDTNKAYENLSLSPEHMPHIPMEHNNEIEQKVSTRMIEPKQTTTSTYLQQQLNLTSKIDLKNSYGKAMT
mmetsp:Transcript_25751/g.25031  ORF Transcript_25751/g.25031 Transcript_25751/m.25031 type:complete len:107 (-) Transcript_25751:338-658(-)